MNANLRRDGRVGPMVRQAVRFVLLDILQQRQ